MLAYISNHVCGSGGFITRADDQLLMAASTDDVNGLQSATCVDFYRSHGIPESFIRFAPPTSVTIPQDSTQSWASCSGFVDVGETCDDSIVWHQIPHAFSYPQGSAPVLQAIEYRGAWVALICGNYNDVVHQEVRPHLVVQKFEDRNRNGARDEGEPPLAGLTFEIRRDSSLTGQPTGPLTTVMTDANGEARLDLAANGWWPGRYAIEELPSDGWMLTGGQPTTKYVDVGFGIGDVDLPVSFGNAPSITVTKTVSTGFTRSFAWTVDKSVTAPARWEQVGGSHTFAYTIDLAHDAGTDNAWFTSGTISVVDHDDVDFTGAVVTDEVNDPAAHCSVTGGSSTLAAGATTTFEYACTYTARPVAGSRTNTATVEWTPSHPRGTASASSGPVSFTFTTTPTTLTDECGTLTDTLDGIDQRTFGSFCAGSISTTETYQRSYTRAISMPQWECLDHPNVARVAAGDTAAEVTDNATVRTCGPARTGALTMGYWQNKNGQSVITTGAAISNICSSGTWLRSFAPFADLAATSTCKQVGSYVSSVIAAANAGGATMNAMLKAQMLATALDVYFSDPSLGGNKIGAAAPLGTTAIHLVKVCANPTGCSSYVDARSAFGGVESATVAQLLASAASRSSSGGTIWYANVKSVQELAKDTFDAINNQVAFRAP